MAKTIITLGIESDLVKQLDEVADAQDVSRSKFIERLLREELQGSHQALKVLTDPQLGPQLLKLFGSPAFVQQLAAALGEQLPENAMPLFERKLRGAVEQVDKAAKEVRGRRKGKGKR